MPDSRITDLPLLSNVTGSVLYAVKGGVDYQVSVASLQQNVAPQAANLVYAGPAAAPGAIPTFRPLVPADIPDLSSLYLPSSGGNLNGSTITNSTITGGQISGATGTFDDNKFTLRDQTDTTKTIQFDASSLSAGTLRVYAMPDGSTTLVGTDIAQDLSNKRVFLQASTLAGAALRITPGQSPNAPANGDMWMTTSGLYFRTNNITYGPISTTVTTFNGRTGNVTLLGSDVTSGLGYTPVNKAGDTINGSLSVTGTLSGDSLGSGSIPAVMIGNDAAFWDVNQPNSAQLRGASAPTVARLFYGTTGQHYWGTSASVDAWTEVGLGAFYIENVAGAAAHYRYNNSQHIAQYKRAGGFGWYWRKNSTGGPDGTGEVGLMTLDDAGNLSVLQNVAGFSDAALKTDVRTIEKAGDLVDRMRGVYYTRVDTCEAGVGVIAQEMEPVLPEVVVNGDPYKSVAYGNLAGVFIEALKEQRLEIASLKKDIADLKTKLGES